jgi:5'(3')-deoxyribonucleotidase
VNRTWVLGVDLDGVCGDYTAAFREVVAQHRGVDPASLTDARGWDFREWGLGLEEFDQLHRKAVLEHRMFRTMPPVEGAADVLWRLSDGGVWIRIITHRLWVNWGHAVAVADTVAWLDHNGIPYRDICFLGAKPEVEADCYVDDAVHNVVALREAGNDVIVFDAPYNRHLDPPRARGWDEIETLVAELMAGAGVPLQTQLPGFEHATERVRARAEPLFPDVSDEADRRP